MNITITFDISPALRSAISEIVGARASIITSVIPSTESEATETTVPSIDVHDSEPETAVESTEPEKAQNLTAEAPVDGGHPETREDVEEPKKRKSRAKKAPSEFGSPVSPAIGDNSSPACACAEPEPVPPEETHVPDPAPEPSPVVEDPAPVEGAVSFACVSYVGARVSETPAPEPAPEPAPAPEKDMSGKGEKGEILSDLTRRALAELDEAGVARDESNRRIRDYGIRHGLKFPSFTALVQILGYADAVAVAKGDLDE